MNDVIYLDQYINNILDKIYSNNIICRLLYYDEPDALTQPDLEDNTVLFTDLDNRRIYPMVYTTENMGTPKSMLYIDVVNASLNNNNVYFKDVIVEITVLSHLSLWELTSESGSHCSLRINRLVHELNNLFNRQTIFGVGSLVFNYLQKVYVDRSFSGYKMCFETKDFSLNG